jgi:hypothetical protein
VPSLTLPALAPLLSERQLSNNRLMDQMRPIMELALRVLSTISVKRNLPDRRDVQELRKLAPDHLANESTNELACGVIQEALKKHRAQTAGKAVYVERKVPGE